MREKTVKCHRGEALFFSPPRGTTWGGRFGINITNESMPACFRRIAIPIPAKPLPMMTMGKSAQSAALDVTGGSGRVFT